MSMNKNVCLVASVIAAAALLASAEESSSTSGTSSSVTSGTSSTSALTSSSTSATTSSTTSSTDATTVSTSSVSTAETDDSTTSSSATGPQLKTLTLALQFASRMDIDRLKQALVDALGTTLDDLVFLGWFEQGEVNPKFNPEAKGFAAQADPVFAVFEVSDATPTIISNANDLASGTGTAHTTFNGNTYVTDANYIGALADDTGSVKFESNIDPSFAPINGAGLAAWAVAVIAACAITL